jgi:hypothetical protein
LVPEEYETAVARYGKITSGFVPGLACDPHFAVRLQYGDE